MATRDQQARCRAKDGKTLVQVRLDPAALARLDRLVAKCGAAGRGEVIERLVLADAQAGPHRWLLDEAIRLARTFLRTAGTAEAALRDAEGWLYTVRRDRL